MKMNLSNVEEMTEFTPIPIGKYHVKVVHTEEKKGIEKGTPYISTWFEVLEGEFSGRKLFKNFVFTEKAMGFMKPFLLAIGYPPDREIDIDYTDWMDEQLIVSVNHDMFKGKTKEVIEGYISLASENKQEIASTVATDDIPF